MALGLIGLAQTGREPRVQDIGKGKSTVFGPSIRFEHYLRLNDQFLPD